MRTRLIALSVLLLFFTPACTAPSPTPAFSNPAVSDDYILALSAANDFLQAWRMRDQPTGLQLLSARLRQSLPEDDLRDAIAGVSNPHHQSYEITAGAALSKDRYRFTVILYHHYTGHDYPEAQTATTLEVLRIAPETWCIDRLPTSPIP